MKIGLVRMKFTPYGGAEVFLSRLIDGLVKNGHECHIFASEWEGHNNESVIFHRIKVIKGLSFLKVLSFAISTYFSLIKEPLDIILSFERTFHQDVYRAGDGCHKEWLKQRKKIVSPFRYLTIILNPFHWIMLFLEKTLLKSKKLKSVIANSEMVKIDIIKHFGLPEDKINVIHNGINSELFNLGAISGLRKGLRKRFGISENCHLILFVGSGYERKGLPCLLEAIAKLKEKEINIKLLVIGKGKIKRYEQHSKKLQIDKDIIFVGPQKDVRGYYAASDLFVLPTLYDPFSNATLEAMACGLPVVTSRFNGAAEVVEKEGMGYIIQNPTDLEEIADKIEDILQKDDKRRYKDKSIGIAKDYSIEKTVNEFLKVLNMAREQQN